MPTYVYKCPICNTKKDIVCKSLERDRQVVHCPNKCLLSYKIPALMKRSMSDELSVPFNFEAYWDEHLCNDEHPDGVLCTGHMQKKKLMREMGHEYKD